MVVSLQLVLVYDRVWSLWFMVAAYDCSWFVIRYEIHMGCNAVDIAWYDFFVVCQILQMLRSKWSVASG